MVVIVDGECKSDERKGRYSEHVCLVAGVRGCDRESLIHLLNNTGLPKQGFRNELVDKNDPAKSSKAIRASDMELYPQSAP